MNVAQEAIVAGFFEAIANGDRETMLALMDPEAQWIVPRTAVAPYAGRHRGAAKIVDMMLQATTATFLPGTVRHRVLTQMSDASRVMAETEMVARQTGGCEYRNFYVFIFEFRDGRICEIREHVDTAYAIQFFGAGQQATEAP